MNPSWGPIVVATAVAWGGALVAALLRENGSRFMRPLVYLALLFFAASALFDILPQSKQALSWPVFGAAVAAGYGSFWAIGRYIAPICPACAMTSFEHDHEHAYGIGLVLVAGVLGVHCFFDGLSISAASAIEAAFGMRVFAAIAIHKLPEGFALALMLMVGGRRAWRAFGVAAAVETTTLVGALASGSWVRPSEFWLAVILADIGGTFLYLAVSGVQDVFSGTIGYDNELLT